MYNPCRGGVRGGADQFTWESVKTDKHRENYLGHSLKAPVGRWQKGKDLSWYAKERKSEEDATKAEKSEMASIKRAEEEAMLIALGHKVVRKESQQVLSKEEMTEALKRNIGERDELNIERIDGVGATSRRAALMTGVSKDSCSRNEGVVFEGQRERNTHIDSSKDDHSPSHKREKSKKKSKKHKKEKKKKLNQDCSHSDESDNQYSSRKKHKKHKREYDSYRNSSPDASKAKHKKKSKHKQNSFSDSERDHHRTSESKMQKKHKTHHDSQPKKRHRHDTSERMDMSIFDGTGWGQK